MISNFPSSILETANIGDGWAGLASWSANQLACFGDLLELPGEVGMGDCARHHVCAKSSGFEVWQYMGSTPLFHEFRHRDWPPRSRRGLPSRVNLKIPRDATAGVSLEVRYS
jgi:hypothetical protein